MQMMMSVSVTHKRLREEDEEIAEPWVEAGGTHFFSRNPALVWQLFTQQKAWLPLSEQSRLARTCKALYGKCEQISEPFRFMIQLWRHLPTCVKLDDRKYLVRRCGLVPCMKWAAAVDPPPQDNTVVQRTWLKDALDSGSIKAITWVVCHLVTYGPASGSVALIRHCVNEMIKREMSTETIAVITCCMMHKQFGRGYQMKAVAMMLQVRQYAAAMHIMVRLQMDPYQKYRDILLRSAVRCMGHDFPLFWQSSAHQRFLESCSFSSKQALRDCFVEMEKDSLYRHIALRCKQQILDYVDGRK
jgi:hypothetical protein